MAEEKIIEGFSNYAVTDDGRVINRTTGKEIKQQTKNSGYKEVCIYSDDGAAYFLVHRLVAKAFCKGYQDGLEVNHKDGDKGNNAATNLEWVTHEENLRHAYETGLRASDVAPRKVRGTNEKTGEDLLFPSIYKAARFMGISQGNICMCCKGMRPAAGGYIWEYVEEA